MFTALAGAWALISTIWKPAEAVGGALATDAAAVIKSALANTALMCALGGALAVLLWTHEQGVIAGLKVQVQAAASADKPVIATYAKSLADLTVATNAETASFRSFQSYEAARKTTVERGVPTYVAAETKAQAQAPAILKADAGSDVCSRFLNVDQAFLRGLK